MGGRSCPESGVNRTLLRPFEWLKAEFGPAYSKVIREKIFQDWRYAQADDSDIIEGDPQYDALVDADRLWRSDPEGGMLDLIALAERGSVGGMLLVGWAYQVGMGVSPDDALSEHWYRLAFEAGSLQAQLRLGRLYEERSDFARCKEVYGVGAADRWPPAMFYLARTKFHRPINPAEVEEARLLLEDASAQGDLGAQMLLGW